MKITIEGLAGEGKTTMAILIAETLKAKGFPYVEVDDFDVTNESAPLEFQEFRIFAISSRKVEIVTIQKPRLITHASTFGAIK